MKKTAPHPDEIQSYIDRYRVTHKQAKVMVKHRIDHEVKINMKNQRDALQWLRHEIEIPMSHIVMWHNGRFIVADPKVAVMLKVRYA
jgi:hypothetical protein